MVYYRLRKRRQFEAVESATGSWDSVCGCWNWRYTILLGKLQLMVALRRDKSAVRRAWWTVFLLFPDWLWTWNVSICSREPKTHTGEDRHDMWLRAAERR